VNERPDYAPNHNERLEFLWDAVLELSITNNLYKDYTDKTEWELTDIRSALVRWSNLYKIALELEFSNFLILWKWEEKSWWRNNEYLLANTLESFLWAIYIDLWIKKAFDFVDKYIYPSSKHIIENNLIKDYKTIIQELCQSKYNITPSYDIIEETWLDHEKHFKVSINLNDKSIGLWEWTSKKKAEEHAAMNAFNNLK
jgi:ribonuclease-3